MSEKDKKDAKKGENKGENKGKPGHGKRMFLHTFGCQMNEYDSHRIKQILKKNGWEEVNSPSEAKLLIVNTCTVRKLAEDKAFSLLGRWAKLKKDRPEIVIGMLGCLAQHLKKEVFQRNNNIDFLLGPRSLSLLPELLKDVNKHKKIAEFGIHEFGEIMEEEKKNKISAYVAVMEGCNQFCSYCAVPFSRGRESSREVSDILREIKTKVSVGVKEIILLGQNVTRYGISLMPKVNLAKLLYEIAEIPDILRIKFLTGHPRNFSDELIQAMLDIPQISRSLHLPLQAGSDKILQAMRRGYTAKEYLILVDKLKQDLPDLTLSTDIIVGFPGETEEDFSDTLSVVEKCNYTTAYCFKFSPRKGTLAAKMSGQIDTKVKEERLDRLLALIKKQALISKQELVGKKVKILAERELSKDEKILQGKTSTNYTVNFSGGVDDIGKEILVEITGIGPSSILGKKV